MPVIGATAGGGVHVARSRDFMRDMNRFDYEPSRIRRIADLALIVAIAAALIVIPSVESVGLSTRAASARMHGDPINPLDAVATREVTALLWSRRAVHAEVDPLSKRP